MQLDTIIMAGGIPQPGDLLYDAAQGQPKSLINIAGKPMGQWVVDALSASEWVRHVLIVGLGPEHGITSDKVTAYVPDHGSLLSNVLAGIARLGEINPDAAYVMMGTSDIPTLTTPMVDAMMRQWERNYLPMQADMYYHIVPRALMEERFPGANRSYVRMREGDFAGADIHIAAPHIAHTYRDLWDALLNNRKNAFKQAARLGWDFFLKLALRRLSLTELEARVPARLGLKVKAILVDYAEAGMDVDKPHQLEICRRDLEQRGGIV